MSMAFQANRESACVPPPYGPRTLSVSLARCQGCHGGTDLLGVAVSLQPLPYPWLSGARATRGEQGLTRLRGRFSDDILAPPLWLADWGIAQWESSGLISRRPQVRFLLPLPRE